MASASSESVPNKSNDLISNLKRDAGFTIRIIFQLAFDGLAVFVILLVLYLLELAINLMGMPDGNILEKILQYSHLVILIIYLCFATVSIFLCLKERMDNATDKENVKRKTKKKKQSEK